MLYFPHGNEAQCHEPFIRMAILSRPEHSGEKSAVFTDLRRIPVLELCCELLDSITLERFHPP